MKDVCAWCGCDDDQGTQVLRRRGDGRRYHSFCEPSDLECENCGGETWPRHKYYPYCSRTCAQKVAKELEC